MSMDEEFVEFKKKNEKNFSKIGEESEAGTKTNARRQNKEQEKAAMRMRDASAMSRSK